MKSTTFLLVGALVAIAIIAIIKKHFFEALDYDLPTQSNAIRFGFEGYEDAEASEVVEDESMEYGDEEVEGYEDMEDDDSEDDMEDDVEHMTKEKRVKAKARAKLTAAAKKAKKAKKRRSTKKPATATAAAAPATAVPATATAAATPEKFENTPRFQELKAKWDLYKAEEGPALTDAERSELMHLLDMPETAPEESFEQFEEMPYQGTEYAMF
jgi:hypothetical protein